MAEQPSTPAAFQEINYEDIKFEEGTLGTGTYGVVKEARWNGKRVAVKTMETEEEKKAFKNELKQLSRVRHPNIVSLYGAVIEPTKTCLVMEFADGGSLYDVLHSKSKHFKYSAAHAISWMLQCARGVSYLHQIKLVHRDLKSPNLLLVDDGTILKICDFGTACDNRTHMTNCTGSAAWMAPEVFESNSYSEKCDVYSFGVVFWEVLARRKPFEDISGGGAFRIMWAVHEGKRPPAIRSLPPIIGNLMNKCWHAEADQRPPFKTLVQQLSFLMQFFHGQDAPVTFDGEEDEQGAFTSEGAKTQIQSSGSSKLSGAGGEVNISVPGLTKALNDVSVHDVEAHDTFEVPNQPEVVPLRPATTVTASTTSSNLAPSTAEAGSESSTGSRGKNSLKISDLLKRSGPNQELSVPYPGLSVQLQPLPPTPLSKTSQNLFKEHCLLAEEYMKIQNSLRAAQEESSRLDELLMQDKEEAQRGQRRLRKLNEVCEEKDKLAKERDELQRQLDELVR